VKSQQTIRGVKTTLHLSPDDAEALRSLADARPVTMTVVRRQIEEYIRDNGSLDADNRRNTMYRQFDLPRDLTIRLGAGEELFTGDSRTTLGHGGETRNTQQPRADVQIIPLGEILAAKLRGDPATIHELTPDQFEEFVCDRLYAMGFEPQRLGPCNRRDGGIDVLFWPRVWRNFPFLGAAQVKHRRSRKTLGPTSVREFASVIANHPINAGLLVTNTSFTPDARWFAEERAKLLRLRDFDDMARWIRNDFSSEPSWREIPAEIELAPGFIVKIRR
jgi:Restriction endonuclease